MPLGLDPNGRREAGHLQDLLFAELKRRRIYWKHFSSEMGWRPYVLSRWKASDRNARTPWIDEMEACWNRLGFTLVPERRWLKTGRSKSRVSAGIHPVVCVLLAALEERGLSREALASAAGLHRNTIGNMAAGKSRGKAWMVEVCFGVLGMPLRPRPLVLPKTSKSASSRG
jgi:lambda repressor-like predicted transcriptional regulator